MIYLAYYDKIRLMTKKIHLKLNEKYKSFEPGFEQDFLGDLIILSGVNGSGKTQLIDIIKGYKSNDLNQKINRVISQEEVTLDETVIAHKSFRDYSSINELTSAAVDNLFAAKNALFSWYRDYRLNFNRHELNSNKDACKRAKALLVEKFGDTRFDDGSITREEIKEAIPRDFVLFQDDIFTNKIGEIFFNYVSLVHNKQAEAGNKGTQFNSSSLPKAPWKELNELFEKLNFGYKFRDFYERVDDEINEQPAIYALKKDGSIDLTQKRSLTDLSDGEKALISLTFAVLASEQTHPKILLLDEYDATLNPSLTNAFFTILEEFFVKKDVQVVVVTHSSSTLSLAPEHATFYEVYKPKDNRPRILQVQRDQYEELAIANKKFYDKIENQETRYQEIEKENQDLKKLLDQLQQVTPENKLQIISEGKNIEHIGKALSLLEPGLLEKVNIVLDAESKTSKQQMKNAYEILLNITGAPKTLFIWDEDATSIVEPLAETSSCYKFCFQKNETNNRMKRGIENLYSEEMFTENVYIETKEERNDGETTTKKVDKKKFLEKIQALENKSEFDNFTPLINKIKSLFSEE